MEEVLNKMLFTILDDATKKRGAFKQFKNYTIGQYMTYIEGMQAGVNRPLKEIYKLCKYHVDPKSFEPVIPKADHPIILNKNIHEEKVIELPNCDESLSLIERLSSAIEVAIKCLKEYRKVSIMSKAEKYEMFFLQGLNYKQIAEKQGLKSTEAIRLQIVNFVNPLLDGKTFTNGVPHFKFADNFIKELNLLSHDALFSTSSQITKSLGLDVDIQDSVYLLFLNLDVLTMEDIHFSCFVPKEEIGKYKNALTDIKNKLSTEFVPIPEDILLSSIKESTGNNLNDDQYRKLLYNFLNELGTIDFFQDGKVWIKDEYLTLKYVRQARIIYKEGDFISKKEIAAIYKNLYHEEMGIMMSAQLSPLGFACCGAKWKYGAAIDDAKEIIAKCVEKHDNVVRLNEIEFDLAQAGLNYPPRTLRSYITAICVPCNTDANLFCHKNHIDEHPEYSWRKVSNYGQENFVVKSIVKFLSEKTSVSVKEAKDWLISLMREKGYNIKVIESILYKYTKDIPLLLLDGENLFLNRKILEETDLKTIGLRGASKKYSMSVISLAINELHKQEKHELLLTDFVPMVQSNIASETSLTRRNVLDILESSLSDELTVFRNTEGRIGIKLTKEIVPVPIYTIVHEQEQDSEQPKMTEIRGIREKISSETKIDWNKLISRMKRELEFYVRQSWFGSDFNIDDALSGFQTFMSSSKNTNLSNIIPQDLYAYWFCSTDEYDRNRYFCDLARCYEALLKDIYYSTKTTPMKKVNGLNELAMLYYPSIYDALDTKDTVYGFKRVVKDLNYKRNQLAHGDYVQLSSVLEAQTITNYVALYVYTIATNGRI